MSCAVTTVRKPSQPGGASSRQSPRSGHSSSSSRTRHWADEGLLDFVDHLVEWATGVPILVVCTARRSCWPVDRGGAEGSPNALTLSLSSLDDEQTAHLFSALLERSVACRRDAGGAAQRAGGNPLYAEEFARMMADRDLTVGDGEPCRFRVDPGDRRGASGRVERRGEDPLLQDAAVVGKVFWLGTVAKVGEVEPRALRNDYTASSGRNSSAANSGRRSPPTWSTRSDTCSRAMLPTARSHEPLVPRSIAGLPSGWRARPPGRPRGDARIPLPHRSRAGSRLGCRDRFDGGPGALRAT